MRDASLDTLIAASSQGRRWRITHAMLTEYMCTETFGSCAILHMEMVLMCACERDRVSREWLCGIMHKVCHCRRVVCAALRYRWFSIKLQTQISLLFFSFFTLQTQK